MMVADCSIVPTGIQTGCLKRETLLGKVFPKSSDVMTVISDRKEWLERLGVSLRPHVPIIHYQNGEGSCSSNAGVLAGVEIIRSINNQSFVHIAPSSLYRQVNRGRDAGSAIDDNLIALRDRGCVPVDMWGGELGWDKPYPSGFKEEAAKYQIDEWSDIDSFEAFMSNLFWGNPICYGVFWGRGGHAITAVEPIYENGVWGCIFANSWGSGWEDGGFDKMWEPQITEGIDYFGGWSPKVATYSQVT